MKIDHHLHTTRYSPDSVIRPEMLIERALAVGLDGVVITEHDTQWPDDELADLAAEARGLVVLSGVEVSTRQGDFLVYGLPDADATYPTMELGQLLKVVRQHGAAIVAAHPFRWDQPFDRLLAAYGPVFDALELVSNNITPQTRLRTEQVLREYHLAATGSSDAHAPDVVGCYYTEFPHPIATMADFVGALHARQFQPGYNPALRLTSGPVG